MASFEICRLRTATGRLVLMAVAVPCVSFAQPMLEAAADRQRQIVQRIEDEQSRNGTHSEGLIEPLVALGLFHQERVEHDLAVAALERARQVVRVNYGLSSIEEAPLLRQLVRSEEARGNIEAGWKLEQHLLSLVRQYPDDLRVVPILHEIADKRMDVLDRYYAGEYPPQIELGCYFQEKGRYPTRPARQRRTCKAGQSSVVIGSLLSEAQSYYTRAIDSLLRNERYSSDELRDLTLAVLRNSYRYRAYRRMSYADGKHALGRLLTPESTDSVSLESKVDRLVQMADWDTVFSDRHRIEPDAVLEIYRLAYALLDQGGAEQASIDRIFSPATPVVLPAFLPNPLATEQTAESAGYIDVAFNITKHGRSEHIEILDATTGSSRSDERDVVRLIKHSTFRPRATNGEFADMAHVALRYYLNE